jgi:hypothetical protein
MAPSNEYMLNRALTELEAVLSNRDMQIGEIRHAIQIAVGEIRNVLTQLQTGK